MRPTLRPLKATIHFRLPKNVHKKLKAEVRYMKKVDKEMSISKLVRIIVEEWL